MNLKKRALEVLANAHLMSLATQDEAGVWVADVIFIYDDDFTIYWMSEPGTRHSKAIEKNPQVAATITASNKKNEPNFGIQLEGHAKKIDDARYDLAVKHRTKRGHPAPAETDDILDGDSWYSFTPLRIHLIDEANFGFVAQDVEL